jgi:hypothetical protein
MPRRNGRGPMGQGPMTGGGRGWCGAVAQEEGALASEQGLGMGWGRGAGRRNRFGQRARLGWPGTPVTFPTTLSKQQQISGLAEQVQRLELALGQLKSRIQDLGGSTPVAESERK